MRETTLGKHAQTDMLIQFLQLRGENVLDKMRLWFDLAACPVIVVDDDEWHLIPPPAPP